MPAFVCRDDALVSVAKALQRPPALVLIEGEAGVGKTRLVQECLWSGGRPEWTVLTVECQPVAESMPLGPVLDGLRRLRDEIGGVELSPLGGALRPLFPEWADDLPPAPEPLEESGATRHRLYRALGELVDRLRVDLLVLEDAHWADSGSLEWLLVAWEHWRSRRSIVVTYRPETVPAASPQLRRLASWKPAGMDKVRIGLEPLDVAGIQQLTGSRVGGAVPASGGVEQVGLDHGRVGVFGGHVAEADFALHADGLAGSPPGRTAAEPAGRYRLVAPSARSVCKSEAITSGLTEKYVLSLLYIDQRKLNGMRWSLCVMLTRDGREASLPGVVEAASGVWIGYQVPRSEGGEPERGRRR